MRSLAGLALTLIATPSALANPLPVKSVFARDNSENVRVLWRYGKDESKSSLTLMDADKSVVYGKECDSKLDTGDFADFPITMDTDDNGFGSITSGGKTYEVHSMPEHSGGISCHKMYSDSIATFDCLVPWTASFQPTEMDDPPTCFDPQHPGANLTLPESIHEPPPDLKKRQAGINICSIQPTTRLVGDGNMRWDYWHKQIGVSARLTILERIAMRVSLPAISH